MVYYLLICASKLNHQCFNAEMHDQAEALCANVGMRLCTVNELDSGLCCGTGCNHDNRKTWTSTFPGEEAEEMGGNTGGSGSGLSTGADNTIQPEDIPVCTTTTEKQEIAIGSNIFDGRNVTKFTFEWGHFEWRGSRWGFELYIPQAQIPNAPSYMTDGANTNTYIYSYGLLPNYQTPTKQAIYMQG
eukprot:Awhi_evm1s11165